MTNEEIEELRKDKARLDWLADDRWFDGFGGLYIRELVREALAGKYGNIPVYEVSEAEWVAERRVQMRVAIDAAMKGGK